MMAAPGIRRRPHAARLWPLLLAAVLLGGCGSGETIILTPVSPVCDHPVDPAWRCLAPLNGTQDLTDGVWLPDDTVVLVGTGGMVLTHDGNAWQRSTVTGVGAFRAICATADGTAVAAGHSGAVAVRGSTDWTVVDLGVAQAWREIVARNDEVWVVGHGGQVACGQMGAAAGGGHAGIWRTLTVPDGRDLSGVCVHRDTVFVCGGEGLLTLFDETWIEVSAPRLLGQEVHSVVATDDGRLLALADTLYSRTPTGWQPVYRTDLQIPIRADARMTYEGGALWLEHSTDYLNGAMLLPRGEAMSYGYFSPRGRGDFSAARDSLNFLAFSAQGGLAWYADDTVFEDPSGLHGRIYNARFNDGSVYVFSLLGQFRIAGDELERISVGDCLSDYTLATPDAIAGVSLDDFYVLEWDDLYHSQGGSCSKVYEFAEPDGQASMATDGTYLYIGRECGLLRWDGTEMSVLLGTLDDGGDCDLEYWVFQCASGLVVALSSEQELFRLQQGEAVSQGVQNDTGYIVEEEDGTLMVFQPGYYDYPAYLFELPTDQEPIEYVTVDVLPACPDLIAEDLYDHPTGVYVTTLGGSSVFRASGSLRYNTWDLLTGPLEDTIDDLLIQPDGTLAAIAGSYDRLYLYQPDP